MKIRMICKYVLLESEIRRENKYIRYFEDDRTNEYPKDLQTRAFRTED